MRHTSARAARCSSTSRSTRTRSSDSTRAWATSRPRPISRRARKMATIYYDKDADPKALRGKTIAVIGYGSQGHAHAQNLRDSGYEVIVGLAAGSKSWEKAERDGFTVREPADAARNADVVALLVPDQHHAEAFEKTALAYAQGVGATRAGVIKTTFAEEVETDWFGEQVILCGGISELMKASFETLVEAGYQPEVAYFECVNEMKLIVDLIYEGGLSYMRYSVSDTAEYGDYTVGPRIIDARVRQEMKNVLRDIKDGTHAKKWIAEYHKGAPNLYAQRAKEQNQPIEQVGRKLREMMPWLPRRDVPQQAAPAPKREPVGSAAGK